MKKLIIFAIFSSLTVLFIGSLNTIRISRSCPKTSCCSKKACCPKKDGAPNKSGNQEQDTKGVIKDAYTKVVQEGGLCTLGGGCCGGGTSLSQSLGYTQQELDLFADANLGLGCGHPVNISQIKPGDTVLDLGSGAGLDCFLAVQRTGPSGKVIGIDMTEEMIHKAQENAKKYNVANVEFRLGDIENMPVETSSVDVIISNCVINLAPSKEAVFKEAYRVLKPGGKMAISDVVLVSELTQEQRKDTQLLCACVSGAIKKEEYLTLLAQIGFEVSIVDEDTSINKKWFGSDDLPIISLKFIAHKE